MRSFTKVVLSIFAIVAMLTSPAFAKKTQHIPRYNGVALHDAIPGYDSEGSVVAIPDPDRSAAWQR